MRHSTLFAVSSVSMLALAIASPAAAQDQDSVTQTTPPGVDQSSTQDDDPAAAPEEQTDSDATAAESAAPLDTGSGDNTIVVTGTRIERPEFTFPNPVQAYTSETIQQAGVTNLTDFLIETPALRGSTNDIDVAGSNLPSAQFVGVNLLDLRFLGEDRTLVLVNGRRHIAGSPGSAAVDINTIPVDLIDRIDILTGGTSAIYGADGVSGVVNFVMKRDFEGLAIRAQSGISQRGDAGSRFISAVVGSNFADGRANVAASYEFSERDRFSQRKRLNYGRSGPSTRFTRNPADHPDDPNVPDQVPLTDLRWLDSSPGGAIDVDFDFVPDFTGEGRPYDLGTPVPGSPFTIGGDSTPQDSYFGDFTPYSRRHIFNAFGHFEVSQALRLFAEGKYVNAAAIRWRNRPSTSSPSSTRTTRSSISVLAISLRAGHSSRAATISISGFAAIRMSGTLTGPWSGPTARSLPICVTSCHTPLGRSIRLQPARTIVSRIATLRPWMRSWIPKPGRSRAGLICPAKQ
jgi:outer membrane receptor protein involved in Fe transport